MTPSEIVTTSFLRFLALVFEWRSGSNLAILFRNASVVRSVECYLEVFVRSFFSRTLNCIHQFSQSVKLTTK